MRWSMGLIYDSKFLNINAVMLPVVFCIVAEPLEFTRAVLLTPPILFYILGFIYHSTFWLFYHPGWEDPDLGFLSLRELPVVCVGFIRRLTGVI